MSVTDSKKWRVRVSNNLPALDAEIADVNTAKNVGSISKVLMYSAPGGIEGHTIRNFIGDTVPDNTDYPDDVAPIGSEYCRLEITAGVVTGSAKYLKTAAGTWTIFGSIV